MKFDPAPEPEDEPPSERVSESDGGALMRETASLLHAAESSAKAMMAPAANLRGAIGGG
ncbi:MAG: hypothetical protein ACXU9S_02215 [Gemmatimonadaceae bacterium]